MGILGILLFILKIIGIILLAIIGILILILCLVLFVPIRYDVRICYDEKAEIKIRFHYLLHIIRAFFYTDFKEQLLTIKVLWFTVGKPKKEKKRSVRKKETTPVKEKQLPIEKTEAESLQPVQPEPSIQPEKKQPSKQAKKPKSKAEPKDKRKKDSEKNSGNSGCVGGIIDVINNISLQLKDERNKRVLNLVLKYVRILLRHALPGSHVIDLKLGLKDPATLGELIGAIAVIRSMTGIVIQVTPDFEQEILEADCYFKGRIRLGTLLYIGLRVYFNKDFKSLLKQLRNK